MGIDYAAMLIISLAPVMLVTHYNLLHVASGTPFSFTNPETWLFLVFFPVFFCKDSFNGRSIGKRILGMQVIETKTEKVADPVRCVLRNSTLPLGLIELIVVFFNEERRIGDRLIGTTVDKCGRHPKTSKTETRDLIFAYLVAFVMTLVFSFPFIHSNAQKFNAEPVVTTYDSEKSSSLTQSVNGELDTAASAQVRYYEQAEHSTKKFISVHLRIDRLPGAEKMDSYFTYLSRRCWNQLQGYLPGVDFIMKVDADFYLGKKPQHVVQCFDYQP